LVIPDNLCSSYKALEFHQYLMLPQALHLWNPDMD
jgi:hypothetical protein